MTIQFLIDYANVATYSTTQSGPENNSRQKRVYDAFPWKLQLP